MESTGFTDMDGVDIYEADVVTYQNASYAVHKVGGEFVLFDEYGDQIVPDWSQTEVMGSILDHRIIA